MDAPASNSSANPPLDASASSRALTASKTGSTRAVAAPSVVVEGAKKHYYLGGEIIRAVDGIDLTIQKGEYLSIMGPSGSGKTTLFNIVGGLTKPTEGTVYIDRTDISKLDASELAWLRCRKIGYVFQTFNLVSIMSALQNVMLPLIFAGVDRQEREDRAFEMLKVVGLGARAQHKPTELSGGQQQRVAIARAFVNNPTIVLADEPTGNLDLKTGLHIIDMMAEMNKNRHVTVLCNTHDQKIIKATNRVVWICDGKVERIERPNDVQT
jgi:putative ABC transport system ATP-binding protein